MVRQPGRAGTSGGPLLLLPHPDPPRDGLEEVELQELTEARWLAIDEVERADPVIFPARIADLLKDSWMGRFPKRP
ncbi:hypothetical protein GCM10029992_13470 [Glycomyces albus]